ncbi:hypothetical protein GCM10011352_20540 [Marinobacterium zhoushanense]|uniref:Fibronectin type-III domain-containing protein n=1 Tax=Marinobacterium zhoushanense TaxID=1679163 RepID=A0ABQ1KFC7_9GAMM|nr:S8 family serine peptidase [Marinobacterium zhoushanense]GGB94389.1 hypothetical protein GCM10011352_20540 [Marinobacterium zhoushanense]
MKYRYPLVQALCVPLAFSSMAMAANTPPTLTDQVIVRFSDPYTDGELKANGLSQQIGKHLEFVRETASGSYVYRLPGKESLPQVRGYAQALMATSGIKFAEADQMMFGVALPDDPVEGVTSSGTDIYSLQWHYQEATGGMDAPAAWQELGAISAPATVRVAVLDTGYTEHPDLVGEGQNGGNIDVANGYDMISSAFVGNDGDGRDADARDPGDWVFVGECGGPYSSYSSWHGTHVAGTIAAMTDNGVGVAGIGYNLIKVVPVRVLGKCGGYTSDIADGIRYAAGLPVGTLEIGTPAQVINMSLGGSGACAPDSEFQLAINDAVEAGTTVVVAAGNSNADAKNYSPASCANVISVAATGRTGARAYYSNYGDVVDLAAPGGDMSSAGSDGVLSTLNDGTTVPGEPIYAYYQGTSMATPHTAAVSALLYIANEGITPAEVEGVLKGTARDFAEGACAQCGSGILTAGEALRNADGSAITPEPILPAAPDLLTAMLLADGSVSLSWSYQSSNESGFIVERSKKNKGNSWSGYTVIAQTTGSDTWFADAPADGTYRYQVRAWNDVGSSAASNIAEVKVSSGSGSDGGSTGTCKGNGPKCR